MKFQIHMRSLRNAMIVLPLVVSAVAASASDIWLYNGRDFTGAFARISRSEPNIPIAAARSLRIDSGTWEVCTGQNYTGECRRLSPGEYRDVVGRQGETVLSVRDVTYSEGAVGYAPPRLQLFDGRDFRGRMTNLEANEPDFDQGINRIGSPASAIVTGGTWEVCTTFNYGGRCQALPPGQYNDLGAQLNYRIVSARVLQQQPVAPAPVAIPVPQFPQLPVRPPAIPVPVMPPAVVTAPVQPTWNGDRARIEVYTETDFRGQAWTLDSDVGSLRNTGFNDRIRSMRIYGGNWETCEDRDYSGECMVFGPGDYRRLPPQMDRAISSLRKIGNDPSWSGITPGGQNFVVMDANAARSRHPVWLYEHGDFRGRTLRAVGDVTDLGSTGMNDVTSSIFISFGNWQFCEDSNYRGRCFILGPGQYNEMPPGMNDSISSFRRVR
jgi:Beta/Gamma crystallin